MATDRKKILLRLDPAVHDALTRWADDELRSTNAQIEFLLRRALTDVGRMPRDAGRMRPRGRPRADERDEPDPGDPSGEHDQPGSGDPTDERDEPGSGDPTGEHDQPGSGDPTGARDHDSGSGRR